MFQIIVVLQTLCATIIEDVQTFITIATHEFLINVVHKGRGDLRVERSI